MVLLLTGSFEGAKRQVYEYLDTFLQYEWLWKDNKAIEYEKFIKKKPSLEDFDHELKKYATRPALNPPSRPTPHVPHATHPSRGTSLTAHAVYLPSRTPPPTPHARPSLASGTSRSSSTSSASRPSTTSARCR